VPAKPKLLDQVATPSAAGITAIARIARNTVDKLSLDYLAGLCAKAGVSVAVRLAA
jgi:hypothetical protein